MRFVHTLLFACPDCAGPIVISLLSDTGNLEDVDSDYILLQCTQCKECFSLPALGARRHYVEEWESQNGAASNFVTATHQLALFENQADSE